MINNNNKTTSSKVDIFKDNCRILGFPEDQYAHMWSYKTPGLREYCQDIKNYM
jgi:hypothetical protein